MTGGEGKDFETYQSTLFLTRPTLRRSYFATDWTIVVLSDPKQHGGREIPTPVHASYPVPHRWGGGTLRNMCKAHTSEAQAHRKTKI